MLAACLAVVPACPSSSFRRKPESTGAGGILPILEHPSSKARASPACCALLARVPFAGRRGGGSASPSSLCEGGRVERSETQGDARVVLCVCVFLAGKIGETIY